MAPDRTLITHRMIQAELERLAGLSKGSTSLHVIHEGERMLWQVGNRFIRVGPVSSADLRLSLDDFAGLHCQPVVAKMREGANG
jgi:hypothetical protein